MIALNETFAYAAEVPFNLPMASDPLTGLTGYVFADFGDGTSSEVQIRLPGGAWQRATLSRIVEKGYGRFAVRLTAAECLVAGTVAIYADVASTQPYRGVESIGTGSGDVVVSGTGLLTVYLAQTTDPVYGAPITGHTWLAGQFRVCFPNGTYQDADHTTIVELGAGLYGLPITSAQTATRGKVYYYANVPTAQPFESYTTILTGSEPVVTPTPLPPTPIPVPIVATSAAYQNHVALAAQRLCQQFKVKNV